MEWSNEHWQGEMSTLRSKIDRLDNEILSLIVKRTEASRNIGKIKLSVGRPVFDPDREREVIENRINFSRALGIDDEFVRKIMILMMDYSKRVQVIEMQKVNGKLFSAKIANPAH
ncbi:MAG: chorismate mutase [Deltaproteobacteria bacterium]|nr:chorismate mutase [Deltaproteobacteria bacterium]